MNGLPKLFGIVNITPDSFSDGGRYLAPEAAIAHAEKLVADGASVVDLGASASNPKAEAVPAEVEIGRLEPVVATLRRRGVAVSVDSFALPVQRWALAQGVEYLNDIHGFPHPELYESLAGASARLIVMHAVQPSGRAEPQFVDPAGIVDRILGFFDRRIGALEAAGVARDRLLLDPGMGFFLGTAAEASYAVLRHLPTLKRAFSLPVLVSVSRKSFLRKGHAPAEAGAATLAAELFAAAQGADYIRTHDPGALRDGLLVQQALLGEAAPG